MQRPVRMLLSQPITAYVSSVQQWAWEFRVLGTHRLCLPTGWSDPIESKQEGPQDDSIGGAGLLIGMRHSRSLPSLASPDLTTPRNLIEVSAWMRQHRDGHPPGSKGSPLPAWGSASNNKALGNKGASLSGKSLSGKGSSLSHRASSVPSIADSQGSSHSISR